MAQIYEVGLGVREDYVKARHWYERAAAAGDVKAQYSLGMLLTLGLGGPKDQVKSRQLMQAAAEAGHPGAMFSFGLALAAGTGGPKDVRQANLWFRQAAAQDKDPDTKARAEKILRGELED